MVGNGFNRYPCQNKGRFEHDGRKYCKIHHPITVKKRVAAREKEYLKRRLDRLVELHAHELLEALKAVTALADLKCGNLHADEVAIINMGKTAIAKAEGKS